MNLDIYKQLEVAVLSAVIIFGSIGTFTSGTYLWFTKKIFGKLIKTSKNLSQDFLLFQKSLNLSDAMILLFYALRELLDLALQRVWYGGFFLCKLTHLLGTLGLYLSSNTIVCIGFYRVLCAWKCRSHNFNATNDPGFSTSIILIFAWLYSLLISLPQLALWETVTIETEDNTTVVYCTTMGWESDDNLTHWTEHYNVLHTLTISPIPCLLILISYTLVALLLKSAQNQNSDWKIICDRSMSRLSVTPSGTTEVMETTRILSLAESLETKANRKLEQLAKRKLAKVMRTSLMLLLVYVICWLPYNVAIIWSLINSDSFFEYAHQLKFTWHFMALSTVFNPWVYRFGSCALLRRCKLL